MKKEGYCDKCDFKFSYEVRSMDDLKSVVCPKCNSNVYGKKAPVVVSNTETAVGNVANTMVNIYFYFYLIFSIVCLLTYYLGFSKIFLFSFILMMGLFVIELFLGFTRNIFGVCGVFVGGVLGYFLFNNILLGITYVFFISSLIKLFINFILNVIIRKCS